MKTVLKTLLIATVLMSIAFVVGCSNKATEPLFDPPGTGLSPDGFVSHRIGCFIGLIDDFKNFNHYEITQIKSMTELDKILKPNPKDCQHPHCDPELTLCSVDIRSQYSNEFFANNYLVFVRMWTGHAGPIPEVVDIDKYGVITFNQNYCPCHNHATEVTKWIYLLEIPNTFKPRNFSLQMTKSHSDDFCEDKEHGDLLPHEFDVLCLNTSWMRYVYSKHGIGFENVFEPVLISSLTELKAYLDRYERIECFGMWDINMNPIRPYYFDVLEQTFTEEFFSKRYLCMIRMSETNFPNSYDVKKIGINGTIFIEQTQGNADMMDSNTVLIKLPRSFRPENFSIELSWACADDCEQGCC